MPEADSDPILSNLPSRYPRIAPNPAQKPRLLDRLRRAVHTSIHEQKKGGKLGDTFLGYAR
jgi:hypothetical protein